MRTEKGRILTDPLAYEAKRDGSLIIFLEDSEDHAIVEVRIPARDVQRLMNAVISALQRDPEEAESCSYCADLEE